MPIRSDDLPEERAASAVEETRRPASSDAALFIDSRNARYREAIETARRYSRFRYPVVLEGESGTGKTVLASQLHAWSPRAKRQFVEMSLADLSGDLALSTLFGHVAGAYTDAKHARKGMFRMAHGGTLFLDELGKSAREVQRALLRVVETNRFYPVGSDKDEAVDVRLIFATTDSMAQLVEEETLLADLYARLCLLRIRLPPLRDRPEDIPLLIEFLVARLATEFGYARPPLVKRDVAQVFCKAEWPRNVRELEAALTLLMINAEGAPYLKIEHMHGELHREVLESAARPRKRRDPAETERVVEAVGSKREAALVLGASPQTVRAHLGARKTPHQENDSDAGPA